MAITSAIMQMRRGYEADFDPDKMLPGEWAVSTDERYVRMCFSPGVCVRMATYDAFEVDMAQIEEILSTCETIEEAVSKINTEVSANAQAVAEYTAQAKQYRDEAEQFRNEAFSATPDGYEKLVKNVTENTVKIDTIIEKAELNIKNSASGDNIHLTDSANSKAVEFGLYGKAEQNGEPTPDNPIEISVSGSDGSVEVVSCGKNLLKYPYTDTTKTIYGITFTDNGDGTITANGTATATATFTLREYVRGGNIVNNQDLVGKEVILSGCPSGGSDNTYRIQYYANAVYQHFEYGSGAKFTPTEITDGYVNIAIKIPNGYTANNVIFKPMIRLATDTDATYEPYKETKSLIPTPNGLSGIKVSSNGNYTDENGQQWICDEIVKYADGSGKDIQRIGVIDSYNGESITTRYMSTTGQLTVGAKVLYVLAEPIITDLSAEEIAEIEKLYTFYPVTNISNDADCGMAVTYIADSKLYIDNKLAIQKAQQEEALATMLLLMPEEVQASMIENDTNNLLNESEV